MSSERELFKQAYMNLRYRGRIPFPDDVFDEFLRLRQGYKLVPVSELQKYVNSIRHYNNSGDYDRIEYDLTSIENVFTKP